MRQPYSTLSIGFLILFSLGTVQAQEDRIRLEKALVMDPVARYGRNATHVDLMEGLIVTGAWKRPKEGAALGLKGLKQPRSWRAVQANGKGWLSDRGMRGGYVYANLPSREDAVYVMRARGHSMVYVNGRPRGGNPYSMHPHPIPVRLKKGDNDFLFQVSRGRLKVDLERAPARVFIDRHDLTSPDYIVSEESELVMGVVIVNASAMDQEGNVVDVTVNGRTVRSKVPYLPALSALKIPVRLPGLKIEKPGDVSVQLKLVNAMDPFSVTVKLKARLASALHKRTFVSNMDSSVQYFATRPATGPGKKPKALILSLHGAGVEAWGQAAAYSSKSWGHIVAATNRRPFGFDWEDWGRRDAIEVLNEAQKIYRSDPAKTYLTGHSMGGHGTWQLGATFPDRFAAIAPSAGWISFWTYGGARKAKQGRVAELFQQAMSGSDTLGLSQNYKGLGIYILHGGGDKNVPATQARTMLKHLKGFHTNVRYHEEPKVGHWWDKDRKEPGADCVDWGPMFDFFATQRVPAKTEIRALDFSTANPGISEKNHWLKIETQTIHGALSRVQARVGVKGFYGTTKNVAKLSFDLDVLPKGEKVEIQLDGQDLLLPRPNTKRLVLAKMGKQWRASTVIQGEKGAERYGPFKEAFTNHVVLVYGTNGTAEENAWAVAKARYDSETFMYRGNGTLRLVPDFKFDVSRNPDHNIVLYGHRDMNSAWTKVLEKSPVQIKRGECRVGEKVVKGKDLATLFVWPRSNSSKALVGVVAGTSLIGMRVTERCPYFVSGVAYPDLTILTPESVFRGDVGVVVTGYFGHDWSVKFGQFAWKN